MARYRALVKCFVDNTLREEGDVFEYNGPANGNLEMADADETPKAPARPAKGGRGGSEAVQGEA